MMFAAAGRQPVSRMAIHTTFSLILDEAGLVRLAEIVAFQARRADCIALSGDLGAGKTTFARAFIRAMLCDDAVEVPSPTFALRQDYEGTRTLVVHFDLYRIADAREIDEIGLQDALASAITLIEWPERAEGALPKDHFELRLAETGAAETRWGTLTGFGACAGRVQRIGEIEQLLDQQQLWRDARVAFLVGNECHAPRRAGRRSSS